MMSFLAKRSPDFKCGERVFTTNDGHEKGTVVTYSLYGGKSYLICADNDNSYTSYSNNIPPRHALLLRDTSLKKFNNK